MPRLPNAFHQEHSTSRPVKKALQPATLAVLRAYVKAKK